MNAQCRHCRDVADVVQVATGDHAGRTRAQVHDRPPALGKHLTEGAGEHEERAGCVTVVMHADVLAGCPPKQPRLVDVVAE